MSGPVLHHKALGIHPGAFVGATSPVTTDLQDHVLWVDTTDGPPYALKMWDVASGMWQDVGSTGAAVTADCLTWPHGAQMCNPSTDLVTLKTPTSEFDFDTTGITLPGGHRLETVAS